MTQENPPVADKRDGSPSADEWIGSRLAGFAQATSRRGFLARCGHVVLAGIGVSVAAAAPINRMIPNVQAASCLTWSLCGLYGRPCDCCTGGTLSSCPAGAGCAAGYWSACCRNPADNYHDIIRYYDCCGGSASCTSSCFCRNRSAVDPWCTCSPYRCTRTVWVGTC